MRDERGERREERGERGERREERGDLAFDVIRLVYLRS